METGDPKQVAVLAVAAVAALGFLFTRLGAKAPPAALANAAVRKAAAPRPLGTLVAMRDPFSHPKLAVATKETGAAPATDDAPKEPKAERPPLLTGDFPTIPSLPTAEPLSPTMPTSSLATAPPSKTEKPAPEAPPVTTVALEATAGATDAVAFLSVDGAESRPFRANERVKGGLRVVRVEDGAAVLAGSKGETTLSVGERKGL